jgi:23S rRNA U2552 (ribose-2'-O)-methylase RlmE/FtsJ
MAESIKEPPWCRLELYKNVREGKFYIPDMECFKDIEFDSKYEYTPKDDEIELYNLRQKIDKYDTSGAKWEYYKKLVNPYELVYTQSKHKDFPTSVCLLNPLSRSYFKIIEILNVTKFFDMHGGSILRSAHVCEGPGGFIEGFFDECEKRRIVPKSATAITLRPNQTNIPGWKRASNFLQKYRSVQILYGADNTGNILKYENQNSFIAQSPRVLLYTGDGGFDFSTDYTLQEVAVFPLLVASVRIGLEVLKLGGYFILKFFDINQLPTKQLLYYLSTHFRYWTLYKPATSRPCNPEYYFIGIYYNSCPTIEIIREWSKCVCETGKPYTFMKSDMPEDFVATLENIRTKSIKSQKEYLESVFTMIETNPHPTINPAYEIISYDWCKLFNVPVHPSRVLAIEALRSDLRASGQL